MVALALLGCGRIGQMHADNIIAHPRVTLHSVYDSDPAAALRVGAKHGVNIADSADAIFSDPQIDGVLVATATGTHADYIETAVAAGKPILCEKPIDLDLGRVNRCAETIAGSAVPVQIGFNRRFDPGHQRARRTVQSGAIGELHQVIITSRDPELPGRHYLKAAGGLMRDMTIHDFDLARYMLDDEPIEVFAVASAMIDRELGAELDEVDTAMIVMRTASGKQCHINNSRTAVYGYDQRIEFLCANGMVISGNRRPDAVEVHTTEQTGAASPYYYFFIERYNQSFMAEVSSFVDCIDHGIPPDPDFEAGRKALILAEAAYKSVAERRLVRVAEIA